MLIYACRSPPPPPPAPPVAPAPPSDDEKDEGQASTAKQVANVVATGANIPEAVADAIVEKAIECANACRPKCQGKLIVAFACGHFQCWKSLQCRRCCIQCGEGRLNEVYERHLNGDNGRGGSCSRDDCPFCADAYYD